MRPDVQMGFFSLPLPQPKAGESEQDFMTRCMGSDVMQEYDDHDQQVAICLSQYHRHQEPGGKAVKVLSEDKGLLGGFGIPFGGPVLDGRDLEGEYFDKTTDFHFDWFPQEGRPVLYEHGLDSELGLEPVGRQIYKSVDDKLGVWVTVQLNMANRYAKAILELAKKGVLGMSSGALAGYVRRQADGKIIDWPWIEQTLTPRPANPYALIAPEAVKHFSMIGIEPSDALKAAWTTAYINDLPDSAFLYIEPGGEKDEDGKTTPRSLRHFPYRDSSGAIDDAHLRNALSRIPQSDLPEDVKERVIAKAREIASERGIGEGEGKSRKKLTLPDGVSFEDLRRQLEETIRKLPGIDPDYCWVADVEDNTCIVSLETGYLRFPFSLAGDGTVTITGPGRAVIMQTTWRDAPAGKFAAALDSIKQSTLAGTAGAALDTLWGSVEDAMTAIHSLLGFDEEALVAVKAGRVMSATNVERMHKAMKAINSMHDALCDGKGCPLSAKGGANKAGNGHKSGSKNAIEQFEALLKGST